MVKEQIRERWGDECAETYDPYKSVAPFSFWASQGRKISKGQRALKSVTFVEIKNEKGEVVKKIRRNVNLFHIRQLVNPV